VWWLVFSAPKTWLKQKNPADRFWEIGDRDCNKEQEANLRVKKKQKTSRSADRQQQI
jgi:hypothetical protein